MSGAACASLWDARAARRVISQAPLVAVSDLDPASGRYTPAADFFIRNHNHVPGPRATTALRLEGEVEKPQRVTPDALSRYQRQSLGAVLECAGNPVSTVGLVGNGLWEGWRLADVLSLASPKKSGVHLQLFARDGYARSAPVERAAEALLVTSLNGQPLTKEGGAPWRVLFPGWYGMDSVKWVDRIVVTSWPLPPRGNDYLERKRAGTGETEVHPLPRVHVKSVIAAPAEGGRVRRGLIKIRGLAWSGGGTIAKVEVSADGGKQWGEAGLQAGSRYEWTLWEAELDVNQPGSLELVCRATDSGGQIQPAEREAARADDYGNNGYHRVRCTVV